MSRAMSSAASASSPARSTVHAELAALVADLALQLLCGARLLRPDRGEADRRDRRHPTIRKRRQARANRAGRADPRVFRRRPRHRLDRGGNRRVNCALYRLAVIGDRLDPAPAAYLAANKPRKDAARGAALPHTPPRSPHLAAAAAADPGGPPRPTVTRHHTAAVASTATRPTAAAPCMGATSVEHKISGRGRCQHRSSAARSAASMSRTSRPRWRRGSPPSLVAFFRPVRVRR